jgi:hypothetical protein
MSVTINASTSSGLVQTADTSGTVEIQSNGTTKFTVASTGAYGQITSGTAVASTSGTSIDFTGLPTWVKRITVMLNGVSTNGTSIPLIQIGSGSAEATGYLGAGGYIQNGGASAVASFTTGFGITAGSSAASVYHGSIVLTLIGSNQWVANGAFARSDTVVQNFSQGSKTTSGTLDRIRITTFNGTDAFDAGSINILYEG